jgi:hypothetical protein
LVADHYCTYFDHRYASQGLALISSLRAQGGNGPVWVLCLDEQTEKLVASFDRGDVRAVPLAALEAHFEGLAEARADRSPLEYYYTMTPHIIRYVFDQGPEIERVAYIDGDMFFFGPVAEMWDLSGTAPVVIIPHNFSRGASHLAKYGTYNVGWVGFKRSAQGLACLDFWKDSCREWCRSELVDGRFADQRYLDRFAEFAPDLAVIQHKGCNLGPWNVGCYEINWIDGHIRVDEDRLIFFHFTGFKRGLGGRWYIPHRFYRTGTTRVMREHIYRPYLDALTRARDHIAMLAAQHRASEPTALAPYRGSGTAMKRRLYLAAQRLLQVYDLVTGQALAERRSAAVNTPV